MHSVKISSSIITGMYLKCISYKFVYLQIGRNDKTWKAWFDTDAPEESPIPDGYSTSLDTFRKLLLIRYMQYSKYRIMMLVLL